MFLFIEFIGVTLVNKIIQVSGAQFYNTSSVHCIVCSSPQVKSPSFNIYPSYTLLHLHLPTSPAPWQSSHCCPCPWFFSFLFLFLVESLHPTQVRHSGQPALYLWVCYYCACSIFFFIRFHIWVKSYGTCLFLTGLFHLA